MAMWLIKILLGCFTIPQLQLIHLIRCNSLVEQAVGGPELVEWVIHPKLIRQLAENETQIYKLMKEYRSALEERIHLLEAYKNEYDEGTNFGDDEILDESERAEAISSHPLMSYRMIRRFAIDLPEILENLQTEPETPLLDKIQEMNNSYLLPTLKDVEEGAEHILRLHDVYDFKAEDLIQGILGGKPTGYGLTPPQIFEIGKYAFKKEYYTLAMDWFNYLLAEVRINPFQGVKEEEVLTSIWQLIREHDALHDKINVSNYYDLNMHRYTRKLGGSLDNNLLTVKQGMQRWYRNEWMAYNFMETCKGGNRMNSSQAAKLYCYYDHKRDLAWRISPLKIEVHSLDPYVIQIHGAIGDNAINYLKFVSAKELTRATVVNNAENKTVPYTVSPAVRSSTYAFLLEDSYEHLLALEKFVGRLTGLYTENFLREDGYFEMRGSEAIQIANYGFGGHFSEHLDALEQNENETIAGDRIATLMFYLNDVELGGHTAFPYLAISVPPIKGSALFWFDLKKNGDVDDRTMHGGCPVIVGEKWIANKWIRYNYNFRHRPCSLNPSE